MSIKILDDNIEASQAQYNLNREPAKIYVFSSKNLDKYECSTVEDLSINQ